MRTYKLIDIINNKKNCTYLLNLLILSYYFLVSFRSIPDSTHYLVSHFSAADIAGDKINEIINFIHTPIYHLIGFIFKNLLIYNIFSIFINFIFLNILFLIVNNFIKNYFISLVVVSSIIFFKFLIFVSLYFDLQILSFGNYLLMNIDMMSNFTVRQIFGLFFILSIFYFLKDKHYLAIFFIFINFFTHPNSNILISGIMFIFYFYMFIKNKEIWQNIFIFYLISTMVAVSLIYLNIYNFKDTSLVISGNVEKNFYYRSLIKDEADDFSFLWLIAYKFNTIILSILTILINFFIYLKNYKFDKLSYLSIAPIILFFLGTLIEYSNIFFEIEFISELIINLQPGWKLIGYSCIPSLIILGKNLLKLKILFIERNIFYLKIFIIFTIITFFSVGGIRNSNEMFSFYKYAFKNDDKNYEDWLLQLTGKENFYLMSPFVNSSEEIQSFYIEENNIFEIKKINRTYKSFGFKNLQEGYDGYLLIKKIKKIIPKKSGIILPPNFFNSRGIFKDYYLYFLEHPDGNFAMGNKKFFNIVNRRMELLLNTNYKHIPNKQSGLNYSFIRQKYNKIDKRIITLIKNEYPKFNYIVSENLNIKNLEIVYKDNLFAIYKF